jgi:hypothetical protein
VDGAVTLHWDAGGSPERRFVVAISPVLLMPDISRVLAQNVAEGKKFILENMIFY